LSLSMTLLLDCGAVLSLCGICFLSFI
jgi:hypothetical protein